MSGRHALHDSEIPYTESLHADYKTPTGLYDSSNRLTSLVTGSRVGFQLRARVVSLSFRADNRAPPKRSGCRQRVYPI